MRKRGKASTGTIPVPRRLAVHPRRPAQPWRTITPWPPRGIRAGTMATAPPLRHHWS